MLPIYKFMLAGFFFIIALYVITHEPESCVLFTFGVFTWIGMKTISSAAKDLKK